MATFPSFNTSNSNEVHDLDFEVYYIMSQQRQTTGNRSNDSATANSLVSSTNLASQTSHNFYPPLGMLPTPEGSDNNAVCPETLMLSPYNMLPGSGHLTMEDTYKEEFYFEPLELESPESGVSFIHNYNIPGLLSPQTSPTLPPDASMNNTSNSNSPTRRQSNKGRYSPITKQQKVSSNNNDSMSQSRRKSSFTNNTNKNNNNTNNNNGNSVNGQNNTNLPSIITGSPNKLPSNSIMFSLLELTSPLMNNMVATSTAPSLQEIMPNLNLGSNLVSDVTNTHSSTSILSNESSSSSFSDKIAPITPSSLMKLKKKPNSPKSGQNELKSNSQQQQQQNQQDQIQQLQPPSKEHSTFIAPTPPAQLNQIRPNIIATTGAASPSGASGRKSIRSNPNASSPLALGPSKSPHSLKPTISPNLKPKLPGVLANEVAEQLANKSNYRSILEGTAQSLGISYSSDVHSSLESRRTTHKAAEQKRRDSLKHSFDELKKVVPFESISSKCNSDDGNTNNNNKSNSNGKSGDGTMKNVSKLFLLKRAHDHIVELEQKSKEKDELIQKLIDELDELKRVKRQKIEGTKKKENEVNEIDNEVDTETKQKDERQTSSNDC